MDGDTAWVIVLGLLGLGMLVVAVWWIADQPSTPELPPPPPPERPGSDDAGQGDDEDVLDVNELWVSPMTWASWQASARRAMRQATVISILVGLVIAWLSLWFVVVLTDGEQTVAICVYALLVGLVAWFGARTFVRRARFARTAREMEDQIVPTLVSDPGADGLRILAHRGIGIFAQESIIIRAEERGATAYLVATTYDVSKYSWIPDAGAGGTG